MQRRRLTLGIELSTQSAKAVVLDIDLRDIVATFQLSYDTAFPSEDWKGGVLHHTDSRVRHTSPRLLLKAFEAIVQEVIQSVIEPREICAIKVDGMQHCTVYTRKRFAQTLAELDPKRNLEEQLAGCFSRSTCPIWEDHSTEEEVEELSHSLSHITQLTGNPFELRFPAAQILKWARHSPEEFEQTEQIQLLSSFLTSLLVGKVAPVDTGDGWGTNLNSLNLANPSWNVEVVPTLEKLANLPRQSLKRTLGTMVPFDTPLGYLSLYFVKRFGFSATTSVLVGTGDNPATLFGSGGRPVISLGSSTTVNGIFNAQREKLPDLNLFGFCDEQTMALTCSSFGAKNHDAHLERFVPSKDWKAYEHLAGSLELSPGERLDRETVRGLHLTHALLISSRAHHLRKSQSVCLVGGAARNKVLRQWIADALNASTFCLVREDMVAPFGCALSCASFRLQRPLGKIANEFLRIQPDSLHRPMAENVAFFQQLASKAQATSPTSSPSPLPLS